MILTKVEQLYIARDATGELNLFNGLPTRNYYKEWANDDHSCDFIGSLDKNLFPELTWEDEPMKVYLSKEPV